MLIQFFSYISSEDIGADGLVRIIFDNVIKNSNYQMSVRALLGIYLVYTTIQFLLGGTNISQHQLLMIMVKIIVIAQLLSTETAWSFFNQYLFSFLLNGSSFVMGLVGSVFEGDSDIFSIILAPQIYIKLAALPFAGSGEGFGLGIAYIVCFIMCIFIVLMATFYSLIIYMMCAIMMAMLIMLAPIFLCFVLFDQTKPLFDNWIKALISFSLQTIILVAGIAMISLLIKDQIYKNLGFRACQKVLYNIQTQNGFNTQIVGNQGRTVSLYIWNPVYSTPPKEVPVNMPLPNAHYEVIDSSGNITTSPYLTTTSDIKATYCPPFQCFGERYPSFPYLNPEDTHDAERLKTAWSGSLVSASDIILLLVCSLMMYGYSSKALGIAESITGGISIKSAAQTARTSGVQNTKTAGNMASSGLNSVAGAARRGVGHTIGALSAARSRLSSIGSNATNWINRKLSKKQSPQDLATDSVEKKDTAEKKDLATDSVEKKDSS
ncbi:MAG: hypothetical protein EB127_09210 [Alphaproteobacteria bacterium]|nr:hypothetical protein [Alphaproteobacteria bacterium]